VNAYVVEPPGAYDKENTNYDEYKQIVWNSIKNFGSTNRFNQLANANYTVPFNKVQLLNWITMTARFGAKYRWEASPRSLQSRFGNTIENSRDIQVNPSFRFTTLYDKVPFLKKTRLELQGKNKPASGKMPGRDTPDPKAKGTEAAAKDSLDKPKNDYLKTIGKYTVGLLMMVKDATITVTRSNGTILPGFIPVPGILGNNWDLDAPGLGFIFGSQKDIKAKAAGSGWLTTDTLQNSSYITREVENRTFRSALEPVRNLKIDVTADRTYSTSYQSNFKANGDGEFQENSPQERGAFNMSYNIWRTSFEKDNGDYVSKLFETMLDYRLEIAQRLADDNPNSIGVDSAGYPNGYGPTQQQVLMGSFLAAYSGKDPEKIKLNEFPQIPYPNWRLTYNASQGIPALQKYFQSFNVTNGYRSGYSLAGFLTDMNYVEIDGFPSSVTAAGDFIPEYRMDIIVLTEQFQPLIGFDMTMKNSMLGRFEYRKTRSLALSFVNNQVTEMHSNELVIGTGYRFKSVPFKVKSLATGKTVTLKSDINVKLDFSIRDNITVLRKIEDNNNQVSTGTRQTAINASADYMISSKMTVRVFYDQTLSKPHVSSQIPTSNINAGLSLRFTLAQ
jgi:cell surface protein SprA